MRVGTDLVVIEKLLTASQKGDFMQRVFTENELLYSNDAHKFEHLAGFFAVKESVVKALQGGIISEVEVEHLLNGAPIVKLKGETKKLFEKEFSNIEISISHTREYATAVCIIN